MASVDRSVDRLREGAQEHGVDERGVGTRTNLLDEPGVVLRPRAFAATESKLKRREEGAKLLRLLLRGTLVHPVQEAALLAGEKPRRGDIGGDHALFDQTMGVGAPPRFDRHDLPGLVEQDSAFRGIEVQGATLAAGAMENPEERVQVTQMLGGHVEAGGSPGTASAEQVGHLLVHQSSVRTHQRLAEARTQDAAIPVDEHLAGDAETILLRTQRAEPVRKRLGQHREHASGKVHGGSAAARFPVERGAGPHVVRHVGDRDDETPTLGGGGTVDGVVEVAGVLAVDGHQRKRPQIPSGRLVSFLDLRRRSEQLPR